MLITGTQLALMDCRESDGLKKTVVRFLKTKNEEPIQAHISATCAMIGNTDNLCLNLMNLVIHLNDRCGAP